LRSSNKVQFSALIDRKIELQKDRAISTCWNHYHTPGSVSEAIDLLDRYDGRARVIGGGTDLLLEIQQGRKPPAEAMVDTSRISGLGKIAMEEGHIVVGCAVTHTQIIGDGLITRHGACLAEGCGVIGGPQVRNVATLAGNVAHALPAADGTVALLVLGAEIEITDSDGSRWMPLGEAFLGAGKSVIDHHRQLLTRIRFRPTRKRQGSAFFRVMRPQGVALPMISMAARLHLDESGSIESARVTVAPAGPVPCLALNTMDVLSGEPVSDELFHQASETALEELSLRSSKYRASSEYRAEMVRSHLPRVLALAAGRARDAIAVPSGAGP